MFRYLAVLIVLTCGVSCKDTQVKSNQKKQTSEEVSIASSGQFIHDDITFDYTYDATTDATEINIKGTAEEKYPLTGKLIKYFFSDLDADGKDEAFMVMKDKNGSNHIEAFYISAGYPIQIYIEEVSDAPQNSTKTFSGQNGQLIEKIEVTTPDNKTITQKVRYNMVAGEAGYSLKPQGWRRDEIKNLIGKYSTKKYAHNRYYNVMYINESESGEWILDAKVKDAKTNKNICEIQTIGSIINKDLYAPLSYVNTDLSGTIHIRFVGGAAVLYTSNSKNVSQLAAVCSNKGTLAGNYTKE